MASVDIDVQRVFKGRDLHQFHTITRQAAQFHQFYGKNMVGKLFYDSFLALFKVRYGQRLLFRLILSKANVVEKLQLQCFMGKN